jgi:hypothetical protein
LNAGVRGQASGNSTRFNLKKRKFIFNHLQLIVAQRKLRSLSPREALLESSYASPNPTNIA